MGPCVGIVVVPSCCMVVSVTIVIDLVHVHLGFDNTANFSSIVCTETLDLSCSNQLTLKEYEMAVGKRTNRGFRDSICKGSVIHSFTNVIYDPRRECDAYAYLYAKESGISMSLRLRDGNDVDIDVTRGKVHRVV